MEKKSYEVLTDNYPRRAPAGVGKTLELYEAEAKYAVLSGDLRLKTADAPAETPPAKKGKAGAGAAAEGSNEGREA